MALQALKRDCPRIPSVKRIIRNNAVGPRLRNGPVAVQPLALVL